MNTYQKIMGEKQSQVWTLLIGIAFIAAGFYHFFEIQELENAGRTVQFGEVTWIYTYLGKYGILLAFETFGLFFLTSGIMQLKGKL